MGAHDVPFAALAIAGAALGAFPLTTCDAGGGAGRIGLQAPHWITDAGKACGGRRAKRKPAPTRVSCAALLIMAVSWSCVLKEASSPLMNVMRSLTDKPATAAAPPGVICRVTVW